MATSSERYLVLFAARGHRAPPGPDVPPEMQEPACTERSADQRTFSASLKKLIGDVIVERVTARGATCQRIVVGTRCAAVIVADWNPYVTRYRSIEGLCDSVRRVATLRAHRLQLCPPDESVFSSHAHAHRLRTDAELQQALKLLPDYAKR
ncbi:MAG: hypothetical protein U0573_08880 [Phycisphaerales bacterium]|nr:hypothetical protein [Planctomycetota bacterium]